MLNLDVEVLMITKIDNHSESEAVALIVNQYISRGYHCCKSSKMGKMGNNKLCIDAMNDKVGAPDLVVWNEHELFFVEVKIYGKGGISCPQMLWYSRHPETKVTVCFVCFTNVNKSVLLSEGCNNLFWSDSRGEPLKRSVDCDKLIEYLYNLWQKEKKTVYLKEKKKVYLNQIVMELLPECKDRKRGSLEISQMLRSLGINTRSGTGNYRVVDFNERNTDVVERFHEKILGTTTNERT